jgi:hypothetical protein
MRFDVESVDLAELSRSLQRSPAGGRLDGFVAGRTVVRDAVVCALGCSSLAAEQIVDTMVLRGFLRYEGSATAGAWRLVEAPDPA